MSLRASLARLIPPLSTTSHKGQSGRLLLIGGSKYYTGAPYFASMSAMFAGVDLVTVICSVEAAVPIKCYSPELMVRPELVPSFLKDSTHISEHTHTGIISNLTQKVTDAVKPLLKDKSHTVVIGPGLGLDQEIQNQCINILKTVGKELPVVIDGDGIQLIINEPSLLDVLDTKQVILTPNGGEFKRLYEKFVGSSLEKMQIDIEDDRSFIEKYQNSSDSGAEVPIDHIWVSDVFKLANAMKNVTILRKGPVDIISDGKRTLACCAPSSLKRCGGQGDVCAGLIGAFSCWSYIRKQKKDLIQINYSDTILCAYAGSFVTRHTTRAAFDENGRAVIAGNVVDSVGKIMSKLFPNDEMTSKL